MIVVAEPNRRLRASIIEQLPDRNALGVDGIADLHAVLGDDTVDLVLLGPGIERDDALATSRWFQRELPEKGVILVTGDLSGDLLREALRAGVRDVLGDDFTAEQLQEAADKSMLLTQALTRRNGHEPARTSGDGKVIVVFSGKGGCGKSFMSSNLSVLLAQKTGKKVALVDLDLQSGDLAIMLQLSPKWTIDDAAIKLPALDGEALAGYLTPHPSGISLLAAPFEPQDAENVSGDAVVSILNLLRQSFDYVVVDTPASFSEPLLATMDIADACVLMTSMDVPSIKNMKIALRTLSHLGVGRDRLRLVLNRADSKVGLHVREVEESIETNIDVALPSSRDVPLSINQGAPLVLHNPKSRVIAALSNLIPLIPAPGAQRPVERAAR